jgi:RNA polymerase sigma factor for flagellar operon FliA
LSTILTDEQRATVLANVPLVEHIVNRVAAGLPASYSRDDLVQTGILGLISATVRYDPSVGTAFSTYAGRRIEGAIIDMLRRSDWAPRAVRAKERRMQAAEERLNSTGHPDETTISNELGCSVEELHQLRRDISRSRVDSLDRPVNIGDAAVPLATTVPDDGRAVEEQVDDAELVGYLREGVKLLPERQRMVVIGFYFEGRSITEMGELLGVTQSRASQIKDEALKMLRAGLAEVYRSPGDAEPADLTARQRSYSAALADSRPWVGQPRPRPLAPTGG